MAKKKEAKKQPQENTKENTLPVSSNRQRFLDKVEAIREKKRHRLKKENEK